MHPQIAPLRGLTMSWTAPERIESPYSSAVHRERDDAAQGARDMMITDCFGTRESMDPGIYVRIRYPQQDKGYIDCGWGRLLEENNRSRVHEGTIPPVIKDAGRDKGFIDCGWGRLLEYNRRHEHIKLGMDLLRRKPVEE